MGWKIGRLPDGTIQIKTSVAGWPGAGICLLSTLFFLYLLARDTPTDLPFWTFLLRYQGWLGTLFDLVFLLPAVGFLLIGLYCAGFREEWRVRRNEIEIRKSFFGLARARLYSDARLQVSRIDDTSGDIESVTWLIFVVEKGQEHFIYRVVVSGRYAVGYYPSTVRELMSLLLELTGWSVSPDAVLQQIEREPPQAQLPQGWRMQQRDGARHLTLLKDKDSLSTAICLTIFGCFLLALFWLSFTSLPSEKRLTSVAWFPAVTLLGGLYSLYGAAWQGLGREEWSVARGFLEVRQQVFWFRRVWRYEEGTIVMSWNPTQLDFGVQSLTVKAAHGERTLLTVSGTGERTDILQFGAFLSQHTGWPMRVLDG